eukprot:7011018-Pyramimonas_sp.AAC.1
MPGGGHQHWATRASLRPLGVPDDEGGHGRAEHILPWGPVAAGVAVAWALDRRRGLELRAA